MDPPWILWLMLQTWPLTSSKKSLTRNPKGDKTSENLRYVAMQQLDDPTAHPTDW